MRVLYSFPHKLGGSRICHTAWHQVQGLADSGAQVAALVASLAEPVSGSVRVRQTLGLGPVRIPFRFLGRSRAFAMHDHLVARYIERHSGQIDIVHAWPLAARQTLRAAAKHGIPSVLERPNAHTRFAMETVRDECNRIGVPLPPGHEHAYDARTIEIEEQEYRLADALLCPSDFVATTFVNAGFHPARLIRHQYGYDPARFFPNPEARSSHAGLQVLFAGGCAPRKGLHFALDAWLRSPASQHGTFSIAGEFIPGYAEALQSKLAHPSIKPLGHRTDVPALMRSHDVLILPAIEEGSALVTSEARGSGCVLLVSRASGARCTHRYDALVHEPGDVETLSRHITELHAGHGLLVRLRQASLAGAASLTWAAAGRRLAEAYREVIHGRKALGASA